MLKKIAFGLAAVLLALGFAGGAQASLLGQTVTCERGPASFGFCSSPTATVMDGGAPEFTLDSFGDPLFSIDLSGDRIVMTALRPVGTAPSQLVTLGDLIWANDPTATITGITNFLVSGVEPRNTPLSDGLVESDVSFTANSVAIDYSLADWSPGGFVSFDLVTTHSAIPEPATLALFGLGLAGLGLAARRKRALA